ETRDLPHDARRAVACGYVRLQAAAHGGHRQAGQASGHEAARIEVEIFTKREEWALDLRAVPERGEARGRVVSRALDANRSAGAPAGVPEDAHGQLAVCPAVARRVDALWARELEREPAGVR